MPKYHHKFADTSHIFQQITIILKNQFHIPLRCKPMALHTTTYSTV